MKCLLFSLLIALIACNSHLEIYESNGILKYKTDLSLYEPEVYSARYPTGFRVIRKICSKPTKALIIAECIERYDNFNKSWLFVVFSQEQFDELAEGDEKIRALIVSDQIDLSKAHSNMYPIFVANSAKLSQIGQYDISNFEVGTLTSVRYVKDLVLAQQTVCLYGYAVMTVLTLLWIIYWYFKTTRVNQSFVLPIHKAFSFLSYFVLLTLLASCYSIKINIDSIKTSDYSYTQVKLYTETLIFTVYSILKSLFWFLVYLLGIVLK